MILSFAMMTSLLGLKIAHQRAGFQHDKDVQVSESLPLQTSK